MLREIQDCEALKDKLFGFESLNVQKEFRMNL